MRGLYPPAFCPAHRSQVTAEFWPDNLSSGDYQQHAVGDGGCSRKPLYTDPMLDPHSQRLRLAGAFGTAGALLIAVAAYKPAPVAFALWPGLLFALVARAGLAEAWAKPFLHQERLPRLALGLGLVAGFGMALQLLFGPIFAALGSVASFLFLAALLVAALFAQWRWWPMPVLLLASRMRDPSGNRSLWQRLTSRAGDLSDEREAFFQGGIWVASGFLLALLAPIFLHGFVESVWLRLPLLLAACLLAVEVAVRVTLAQRDKPRAARSVPSFLLDGGVSELPSEPSVEAIPTPDEDLLEAARRGDAKGVKTALAMGANANARPPVHAADQRLPLVIAATMPDLSALRALIADGADVNLAANGVTPLLAATKDCYDGRVEAVMTLIANGANVTLADGAGNTPLHFAALTRDPAVAQSLIDAGADVNAINREGMTPIGLAAEAANWAVLEFLLKCGAKAEMPGATPALLFAAAVDGDDPRGVKALLKAKAKVDSRGPNGRTALMVAALADNAEIADVLVAAGAPLAATDDAQRSALTEAARSGANRVLQRLFLHKLSAEGIDGDGRTVLHLAASAANSNAETIRLLVEMGADPDARDRQGRRAVDVAAAAGRWPQVMALDPEYPVPSAHIADENDVAPTIRPDAPGELLVRAATQGRFPLYQELLGVPRIAISHLADALAAAVVHGERYLEALLAQNIDPFAAPGEPSIFARLCAHSPVPWSFLTTLAERATGNPWDALPQLQLEPDDTLALIALIDALAARRAYLATDSEPSLSGVLHWPLVSIERLLAAGADPNGVDAQGNPVLIGLAAARRSDARELAPLLIRAGADPARRARDGSTAAGVARYHGQFELAQLLDWPPGAHPGTALDGRALATAGKRGDLATIDRLLALGIDIDAGDEDGNSAVIHAAGKGQVDLMRALLDRGASTTAPSKRGITPLGAAVLAGQAEAVEFLLQRGVGLESPIAERFTALGLAAGCLRLPMVDLLIARGARIDGGAESALWALLRQVLDATRPQPQVQSMLERLLQAGANGDQPSAGLSPLLFLVGAGLAEPASRDETRLKPALAALLAAGANPNAVDRAGRTALHWVCRHGLIQCGNALIESGADPRIVDDDRKLALDLLSPRHRIHLGPVLRQAAEAWNRQSPRR